MTTCQIVSFSLQCRHSKSLTRQGHHVVGLISPLFTPCHSHLLSPTVNCILCQFLNITFPFASKPVTTNSAFPDIDLQAEITLIMPTLKQQKSLPLFSFLDTSTPRLRKAPLTTQTIRP